MLNPIIRTTLGSPRSKSIKITQQLQFENNTFSYHYWTSLRNVNIGYNEFVCLQCHDFRVNTHYNVLAVTISVIILCLYNNKLLSFGSGCLTLNSWNYVITSCSGKPNFMPSKSRVQIHEVFSYWLYLGN